MKEQIRRIRLSVIDFERGEWAEGERAYKVLSGRQYLNEVDVNSSSEYYRQGTVFQTAVLFIFINPETSSRVTLALLGIGFQPNLAGFLW